jgi:hypothetical protein
MNTTCTVCTTAETARRDKMCPNCAALSMKFDPKTNAFEDQQIQKLGSKCVDCGFTHAAALKLVFKLGNGATGGKVCPIAAAPAMSFCLEASANPQNFFIRCHNCQSKFHRSAGRPPKYTSYEERYAARKENREIAKITLKRRAIAYYGTEGRCTACEEMADGLHFIGEPGRSHKRSREWVYAQILRDPEFARRYAPFCNDHRPGTYFERAKRGEVPVPPFWAR